MAQEAARTATQGLVILQTAGVYQDSPPCLRNAVQSHKFTKGQLQHLMAQKPPVAVYGVLSDAVQVHGFTKAPLGAASAARIASICE